MKDLRNIVSHNSKNFSYSVRKCNVFENIHCLDVFILEKPLKILLSANFVYDACHERSRHANDVNAIVFNFKNVSALKGQMMINQKFFFAFQPTTFFYNQQNFTIYEISIWC